MQLKVSTFSNIPFVRLVLPFILGIVFCRYFPELQINWILFGICFLFIFLFVFQIIPALRSKYSLAPLWGIVLNIVLFISAFVLTSQYAVKKDFFVNSKSGYLLGEIIEQPTEKEKSIKTVLEIQAIRSNNEWLSTDGKVILYFQKDKKSATLKNGDRIIFEPALQEIENAGNPKEFDYKQYLAFHLITHQAYLKSANWKMISSKPDGGILLFADNLRKNILSVLVKYGFKGDAFSVTSALTLGYVNELDSEVKQAYISSGAMHVLSVSGLHVGIVFVVLDFLLFFMSKKKRLIILKTIIIVLFLWGYALLTGLSPAVLRAAAMFSFVVIGRAFNRQTNIYNSLSASALILLIVNPLMLFDVGFQLSYLALLGIVYYQPMIYKLLYFKYKIIDWIWALTSVGIAAQLVTFPLSLYYFHQFPNYFLISGLIVIPLSTLIIYLAMILFAISPWEWGATWVAKGLIKLVDLMNWSCQYIENLPGSVSKDIPFNLPLMLLFYLSLILVTLFIVYKKIIYLRYFLISIILILCFSIYKKINTLEQRKLYVYNIRGVSSINFIDGSKNVLFSDIVPQKTNMLNSLKGNWLMLGVGKERIIPFSQLKEQFLFTNLLITNNDNLFFKKNYFNFYGCRIVAIRDKFIILEQSTKKLDVEYIVLSNNVYMNISDILKVYNPSQIIIDASNSKWRISKWIEESKKLKVECFAVTNSGAFMADI
jgi:competence protein ComEC